MATLTASTEFKETSVLSSSTVNETDLGSIDTSGMVINEKVLVVTPEPVMIPPQEEYQFFTPEESTAMEFIGIRDFKSNGISASNDTFVPILKDKDGVALVSYNGATGQYKITFKKPNDDTLYNWIYENELGDHTASYENPNGCYVRITFVWEASGYRQFWVWVDNRGTGGMTINLSNAVSPEWTTICSKGFSELAMHFPNEEDEVVTAHTNFASESGGDTDTIVGELRFTGTKLVSANLPTVYSYTDETARDTIRHNETYIISNLTVNKTIFAQDFATQFSCRFGDSSVAVAVTISFPNESQSYVMANAGDDDVEFTKLGNSWHFYNRFNNTKGLVP